jgi:hypothetical protein
MSHPDSPKPNFRIGGIGHPAMLSSQKKLVTTGRNLAVASVALLVKSIVAVFTATSRPFFRGWQA